MNLRFNLTLGALFIAAGLLFGSQYVLDCSKDSGGCTILQTKVFASDNEASKTTAATPLVSENTFGSPVHISIPSIDIDVAIEDGEYNTEEDTWTTGLDTAYFATVTSLPNETEGNTFIYGHNRSNIFQNLSKIQKGAQATVRTNTGQNFIYEFVSVRSTNPHDVSVLDYEGSSILTLQTCSGLWDQYRSLYTFAFKEVR